MRLFDARSDLSIVLHQDTPEAIMLAAWDLQRDLRSLSGKDGFPLVSGCSGRCIRVETVPGEAPEHYTVTVGDNCITVTGSDVLGTVYGIYAVSTRLLGVLPVHRLIDRFPEQRQQLDLPEQVIVSPPRPVRYRGWFINDEDLLSDFKLSGGKRRIDYPFYGNTMDVSLLDMILETALRLEINLVIPASFVDILNPPEAALVAQVCRRGLYVSQHHIEPVGVSHFTAENYLNTHGYADEAVSFVQNRSRMEEIWRTYIEAWAVYGKQVVWQLGLRGKGDRAVWQHDPTVPDDNAARGRIISDAIATQYRMIADTLGTEDFHSTSTLWMEGAQLYAEGQLRFPKNTTVILSDVGFSQLFGDDFFRLQPQPGTQYGIYYHLAYWHTGPHLVEGNDPRRMAYSYQLAAEKGCLSYSILNVSNVRPMHIGIWLNALLLEAPDSFQPDTVLDQLFTREETSLYLAYFDHIPELGAPMLKAWCDRHLFHYHDYGQLPFPLFPAQDAMLRTLGLYMLKNVPQPETDLDGVYETLRASLPRWEALLQAIKPETLYSRQFLRYPCLHMLELTRWVCAAYELRRGDPSARETGMAALRRILTERKVLEQGQWENWHRGDTKVNIPRLLEITEEG